MSNDFEKCMQIAEFAQKNQQDRRQYEFKIFISYMTLLVLAIWKTKEIGKIDNACIIVGIVVGLSYLAYFVWCLRLALANYNDETRRNYYLAIAEDRLNNIKPVPTEYPRPPSDKIMMGSKLKKAWSPFWNNWSIWFTALLPALLVVVLAFRLCCCYENIVLIVIGIALIFFIILAIIFCDTSSKRKDK